MLLLAREMGVLKMGTIGLDGTKIHANASRHSALSYEHAGKIAAQLQAEVAELMAKAEAVDAADIPDGMSISDELARREERLRKIAEARTKIEVRAEERHAREMAEYEAKFAARDAKTAATGKTPGGKPPQPPTEGPLPSDQINLTDKDSRIMPVAGGGSLRAMRQCASRRYAGSLLVVAIDVVLAPNDKQQLEPMLSKIGALPDELGEPETLLADTGYFSAANVEACEKAGIEPLIAMGRQPHHPPLDGPLRDGAASSKESNAGRSHGASFENAGRQRFLCLAQQTPEPVFGIIKAALGFRQFSLRGLDKVRGEWSLVTMAWNMKRMFALSPA